MLGGLRPGVLHKLRQEAEEPELEDVLEDVLGDDGDAAAGALLPESLVFEPESPPEDSEGDEDDDDPGEDAAAGVEDASAAAGVERLSVR